MFLEKVLSYQIRLKIDTCLDLLVDSTTQIVKKSLVRSTLDKMNYVCTTISVTSKITPIVRALFLTKDFLTK